ncbi:Bbp3 (modular protein) [uncultured Alphaproteobacteria bacterium]|uniref:Bbp3 (Modular protein) n=1 Tax=uncultured Alphaproteobacteria bacterium TaxID=91750 RepID=A0A212JDL2_9PROT|nr:Bbp3 (modular protein) [uncultured Alphaproteobacteria bacterium]
MIARVPPRCPAPPPGPRCPLADIAAKEAADAAVRKTFAILGVDVGDPESVATLQSDLRFGRAMREAAGDLAADVRRTATRAVLIALAVLVGYGIADWGRRLFGH